MGVRHRQLDVEGVQFHPESVLTPEGPRLLENFLLSMSARARQQLLERLLRGESLDEADGERRCCA